MALDYDLELVSKRSPKQIIDLLVKELQFKSFNEQHILGAGVSISVISAAGLGDDLIADAFGFRPTIHIGFRLLHQSDEYEDGKILMTKSVMTMLHHEADDAVFLFQGETVLLQRISGKLVINNTWFRDGDPELAYITLPHDSREIQSPLM